MKIDVHTEWAVAQCFLVFSSARALYQPINWAMDNKLQGY